MKPQVETVEKKATEWILKVTVSPEDINEIFDEVTRDVCRQAELPGFRKGKAPKGMVEKAFGGRIYQNALERTVDSACRAALVQEKIAPLAYPDIQPDGGHFHKGEAFTFKMRVEIVPEVNAGKYKGLKVEVAKTETTQKEVDDQIELIRDRMAEFVNPEGRDQAQNGDMLTLDYEGFNADGTANAKVKGSALQVELGSGRTIPGFEEGLVGVKAGEVRELPLTFPSDYYEKDLAGKPVTFRLSVKEIKIKKKPTLTDEWVAKLGNFKTVLEFRSKLRTDLDAEHARKFKDELRVALRAKLVQENPLEVPKSMADGQLNHIKENMERRLKSQYIPSEKIKEMLAKEEPKLMELALEQVKAALLMHDVARKENLAVTNDDIDSRLKNWLSQSEETLDSMRAKAESEGWLDSLRQEMLDEKVYALLEAHASIKEIAAS